MMAFAASRLSSGRRGIIRVGGISEKSIGTSLQHSFANLSISSSLNRPFHYSHSNFQDQERMASYKAKGKNPNKTKHSSFSFRRNEDQRPDSYRIDRDRPKHFQPNRYPISQKPTQVSEESKEVEEDFEENKEARPAKLTTEWEGEQLSTEQMEAVKHFHHLGINQDLSKQIITSFTHIQKPTQTQALYFKAVRKPSDVILRAHTASGKSFAGLISMLNKYPNLYEEVQEEMGQDSKRQRTRKIESIIVVPSRELALQYGNWALDLVPKSMHSAMDSIVDVRFYTKSITSEEHMKHLYHTRPRILVITAKLLWELLQDQDAERFLVRNMNTMLLDEVDALFDLPGKFPNKKLIWKHSKHPPPAIEMMKKIMAIRDSHSSGERILMSGFESEIQVNKVPTKIKDRTITGSRMLFREEEGLQEEGKEEASKIVKPMQLIVMSATANSVLRHYLGSRTGWLRTGLRDPVTKIERGKWLDMTGLSKGVQKADEMKDVQVLPVGTYYPNQLPNEIIHHCIVVDQLPTDEETHPSTGWRNLKVQSSVINKDEDPSKNDLTITNKPSNEYKEGMTIPMLTCLAYLFATQRVQRGLLVISDTLSSSHVITFLREVGVPVHTLSEFQDSLGSSFNKTSSTNKSEVQKPDNTTEKWEIKTEGEEFLLVANKSAIRGLDIPGGISHTFILGMDTIGEPAVYTHIAGRVSRLGNHSDHQDHLHQRPSGSVITILRGLSEEECKQDGRYNKKIKTIDQENDRTPNKTTLPNHISAEERKMVNIYQQLSLPVPNLTRLRPRTEKRKKEIDQSQDAIISEQNHLESNTSHHHSQV